MVFPFGEPSVIALARTAFREFEQQIVRVFDDDDFQCRRNLHRLASCRHDRHTRGFKLCGECNDIADDELKDRCARILCAAGQFFAFRVLEFDQRKGNRRSWDSGSALSENSLPVGRPSPPCPDCR